MLGGGVAGHRAAAAARRTGASVAHAYRASGASPYILGFNVPIGHADSRDSPEVYFEDIVKGGYGLNDRRLVQALAEGVVAALEELDTLGVPFAREGSKFAQLELSGNTYARSVYHPKGLGRLALKRLGKHCAEIGVRAYPGWKAVALLQDRSEIVGALLVKINSPRLLAVHAGATVLATGGIGAVYADSTYPADVTSDSHAMAYAAGATLIDMEFVQFEPTVIVHPEGCKGMAMPTAMLGDGAHLINAQGERFMFRYNPEHGERKIEKARMALCIQREIDEGRGLADGTVLFDATRVPADRLESYVEKCRRLRAAGCEPATTAPHVRPAAHSHMGGIYIDARTWTGVPGLFAAGEAAGGIHGASRLAGNGASEVFVFGGIAGREAAAARLELSGRRWDRIHANAVEPLRRVFDRAGTLRSVDIKSTVRRILLTSAGLYRNRETLVAGMERIDALQREIESGLHTSGMRDAVRALESDNMVLVARFIAMSALAREESRGAHQRTDFPARDDVKWLCHIGLRKGGAAGVTWERISIK